jgi:hypothetical protein
MPKEPGPLTGEPHPAVIGRRDIVRARSVRHVVALNSGWLSLFLLASGAAARYQHGDQRKSHCHSAQRHGGSSSVKCHAIPWRRSS